MKLTKGFARLMPFMLLHIPEPKQHRRQEVSTETKKKTTKKKKLVALNRLLSSTGNRIVPFQNPVLIRDLKQMKADTTYV